MNYHQWLATLSTTVQDWSRSQAVTVCLNRTSPPAAADVIEEAQRNLDVPLPADLIAFYRDAAAQCEIEFTIDLPPHLEIECDRSSSRCVAGGFNLAPVSDLPKMRRGLCEVLDSIPVSDPSKFRCFYEFGIPIWITRGDDFVVYVNSARPEESGIYFMYYGGLLDAEWNFKYADSLTEWLEFLASSCYLGPEADNVLCWHNGRKLLPNGALQQRVLEAIALNRPREKPSMEELLARIKANEAERAK